MASHIEVGARVGLAHLSRVISSLMELSARDDSYWDQERLSADEGEESIEEGASASETEEQAPEPEKLQRRRKVAHRQKVDPAL